MDTQKRKILIVEDEPLVVRIVEANLKIEGFEVIVASDGEAGLELAQSELPCLIILDVLLPKMHGWEVLRHLKATPATQNIPIIVLTVLDALEYLEHAQSSNVEKYIVKPFEPEELLTTVRELLKENA
jgi:DNA-binding response OmpR family regulator